EQWRHGQRLATTEAGDNQVGLVVLGDVLLQQGHRSCRVTLVIDDLQFDRVSVDTSGIIDRLGGSLRTRPHGGGVFAEEAGLARNVQDLVWLGSGLSRRLRFRLSACSE